MSSSQTTHFDQNLTTLSDRFSWAAEEVFGSASPIYRRLASSSASDENVLALAAHIPKGQPVPNLLFGTVHYLLLTGVRHPLGDFYPSITASPRPIDDIFPAFQAFCRDNAPAIIPLLARRRVQTNEVRRCACLLPAFELVRRRAEGAPLATVEIGPSSGLNMLWDKYAYVYNSVLRAGDPASAVRIACDTRGPVMPPIPETAPQVVFRAGIDIDPGDVRDQDAMLWQRAMLWPDQPERADLFWKAVGVARADPPRILAGDALDLLPGLLAEAPPGAALTLVHSYVLNQFPPDARHALQAMLETYSLTRPLYRVSIEWYSGKIGPQIELFSYRAGQESRTHLAACDQHGAWLEWLPGTD